MIMRRIAYHPGDLVIYRRTKHSQHPGPRAQSVSPAANGDEYTYVVDKFWMVDQVGDDGSLTIRTRRGKTHTVSPDDPSLRKANWWERFWHRDRFPAADDARTATVQPSE